MNKNNILDNLHMLIGTLALLACVYFYIDYLGLIKKNLLIDSFEGKIGVDTVDYGSSSDSSMTASSTKKYSQCGTHSMQLDYNLKKGGYVYCAKGSGVHLRRDSSTWQTGQAGWRVHPDSIKWGDYRAFKISLRGTRGRVAIDVKDSGGELLRKYVYLKKEGWNHFEIPFSKFSSRSDWQPETAVKNGMIDFPLNSFQIEPKSPGQGTLYVDCVTLLELKKK